MHVGVLGSGVMGKQLAALFAVAGHDVTVWDVELSAGFRKDVQRTIRLFARQRHLDESVARDAPERIRYGTDWAALQPCELVLEAVKEDRIIKKDVLSRAAEIVPPRSIVASNTSTLSIAELSTSVSNPARFLGLHFFNPVVPIELVEMIRGPHTADETVAWAREMVVSLGKKAILVPDLPGFIVNHLLFLMINEAVRLVETGAAAPETIDQCMRLGAGHPRGPLELADYIGLDVCLDILENLHAATSQNRYRPAQLLRQYVEQSRLGRKSGGGFYA